MRRGRQLAGLLLALPLLASPSLLLGSGDRSGAGTSTTAAAGQVGATGECPQRASTVRAVDRVAGPDRYATSACASKAAFAGVAPAVVLARGDDHGGWPDALAGTVLADAVGGPVLLTDPQSLPVPTRDELRRLRPLEVLVLGGPAAVSDAVVAEAAAAAPQATLRRVAGEDRFATAVAVSREARAGGTAFVVNGFRPADALVAGAPAARAGAALLLVDSDVVPDVTADALNGVEQVVVVGGYGVVSDAAEARLADLVGRDRIRRVSGGDRFETAASVARAFPVDGRIHLANGADRHLVDAIGAGWSAARPGGGVVLYAERDRPGHGTDRYLRLGGLTPTALVRLVGGQAVLSAELVAALEARYQEATVGGPAPQLRGTWVHLFDEALKSPRSIDRVLDAAAAANLNTVIVEVARRQDAYYTSQVLPRTNDPTMPAGLDLLARLLPAARDRGLAVHAWVPTLPACHPTAYDCANLPADHVWRLHGPGSGDDWATYDVEGRTDRDTFALDPGHPAVQDHAVAVYREIVERYAVDAVHLDYLRYPGTCRRGDGRLVEACYGYNPTAVARFNDQLGRSGPPAPDDPAWLDWRRAQTRQLAARITEAVHAVRPDVAVTAAVIAWGEGPRDGRRFADTPAYRWTLQDWPSWVADGLVDAVFPMAYFDEARWPGYFAQWTDFAAGIAGASDGIVAVGQGAFLNPPSASLRQLEHALSATDGAVVYSAQQDERNPPFGGVFAGLRDGLFAEPAPAPSLR
ncbi:MAG: cell wall-binding repeat-containing protein [Actinobacteria bacterium]|nr:cell wall-binding repeat-containing protein [Actinomycetota bacterium]